MLHPVPVPRALLVVVLFLALAPAARAQDAPAEDDARAVTLDVTFDLASRYAWRGIVLNDEAVLQPSFTLGWKGWSAGAWGSFDLTDWAAENGGNDRHMELSELDVLVDYTHEFEKLTLTTGWVTYRYPGTGLRSTSEIHAGASWGFAVSPRAILWYDIDEACGVFLELGADHEIEVTERVSVALTAMLGWADDNWNGLNYGAEESAWTHAEAGASVSIALGEHAWLRPFLRGSTVLDDDLRDAMHRPDALVGGVGVDWSW